MGNRGRLHYADKNIVQLYERQLLITCARSLTARYRELMALNSNTDTDLLFLDKAIVYAAGYCSAQTATASPTTSLRPSGPNPFPSRWPEAAIIYRASNTST
ncbi:hypothetical protein D3C78_1692580 [compost metagenome]